MKILSYFWLPFLIVFLTSCSGSENNRTTNTAPVAASQSLTTDEDTPLTIVLTASNTEANTLSFTIVSAPENGLLSGTAPNLTYTPDSNFSGTDSFTFLVNDGSADSSVATVLIVISAVNDAFPVATDDSISLYPGQTVSGSLQASDIDGDSLTFSIISSAANGTLILNTDTGTYSYTLNSTAGTDSFTFVASDGYGDSNIASVSVSGLPPASAPSGLSAVAGDQRITLNWDPVTGATSYTVYISSSSGAGTSGTEITGVTPPFDHTGLNNGNAYFYVVSADNAAGQGPASIEVSTSPADILLSSLYFFDNQLTSCINTAASGLSFVHELTSLDCSNMSIFSLSGLEKLTSLASLNLGFNNIQDISALSSLTDLTSLNLDNNVISDISSLARLTKLTSLYLQDGFNAVSDLSALAAISELQILNLNSNNVSDLTPVSGLTRLTTLRLSANAVSDVSPLQNLTNLAYLDLSHNIIGDISPLTGLINLTYLNIAYGTNYISDISALTDMTQLTALWLNDNEISNLSPLANLTNLVTLQLGGNNINDVTSLAGLSSLMLLSLSNNNIIDISALSAISSLRNLQLAHNYNIDINTLVDFTQLTSLDLSYVYNIVDASPLTSLVTLQSLNLNYNGIIDVSPLSSLTSLTILGLASNNIGGSGVGNVDTLSSLSAASNINLNNNTGMSCSELDTLITALGSPPVSLTAATNGVNCTNP